MDIGTVLVVLGLSIDIVGVILLFVFWLPKKVDYGGLDQSKNPASVKAHTGAKVGLALLMLGFVLQIVGTIYPC